MPCGRHSRRIVRAAVLVLALASGFGCNGGGSGIENDVEEVNEQPNQWDVYEVAQVTESGTTTPYVTARAVSDGTVHIACYNAVTDTDDDTYHQLDHMVWTLADGLVSRETIENTPAPSGVEGFDGCTQYDMALDSEGAPVFIYPVRETHVGLYQDEADIMINFGGHEEYTGAIGYVARNPVYTDGHATANMSVAVDSSGDVHVAYQFFTENMDSYNYLYPDLFYAHRSRSDLGGEYTDAEYGAFEEAVDGNTYIDGSWAYHNSVGYACRILLDSRERPVIVYGEHPNGTIGSFALKAAFRDDAGNWQVETIEELEDEWTIGHISAAFYSDGSLAVAYALRSPDPEPDDAHRLKFATNQSGEWSQVVVDESTWCGSYCALAINSQDLPAIAYYDEQSHSYRDHLFLKYAAYDGERWETETVDEYEKTGRFNSLWFDDADIPNICSYSDDEDQILIFRLIDEN